MEKLFKYIFITIFTCSSIGNSALAQNSIKLIKNGGNGIRINSKLPREFKGSLSKDQHLFTIVGNNKANLNWSDILILLSTAINQDVENSSPNVSFEIIFAKNSNAPFLVGKQNLNLFAPGKIAESMDLFFLQGNAKRKINSVEIKSEGVSPAIIKYIPGLYYGSFIKPGQSSKGLIDGVEKVVRNNSRKLISTGFNGSNFDAETSASIGFTFRISNCKKFKISNIIMDGNIESQNVGGALSDRGIQGPHIGLAIYETDESLLANLHIHHFGLDALMLSKTDNTTIKDCIFEYNGRQGCSWVGGRGLNAYNSSFSKTGRLKIGGTRVLISAPGSGLDIEPETDSVKRGYFFNCKFIDNEGCALVNDLGQQYCTLVDSVVFENCIFEDWDSYGIWVRGDRYNFKSCIFQCIVFGIGFGLTPDKSSSFVDCTFTDKLSSGKKIKSIFKEGYLLDIRSNNCLIKNAKFECYDSLRRAFCLVTSDSKKPLASYVILDGAKINFYGVGSEVCNPWINTSVAQDVVFEGNISLSTSPNSKAYHGFYSRNTFIGADINKGKPTKFALEGKTYHIAMSNAGLNKLTLGVNNATVEYKIGPSAYFLGSGDEVTTPELLIGKNATWLVDGTFLTKASVIDNDGNINFSKQAKVALGKTKLNTQLNKRKGKVSISKATQTQLPSIFECYNISNNTRNLLKSSNSSFIEY